MKKKTTQTKRRGEEVWITPEELGPLEGKHPSTIRVRIRTGRYKQIRKGQRFGDSTRGRVWFVSIYDRAISSCAREKYFLQREIKETLKIEIKNVYEKLRKRRFMEMTVREFFKTLSEDMFL
jgi:hypothetical protein